MYFASNGVCVSIMDVPPWSVCRMMLPLTTRDVEFVWMLLLTEGF